MRATAETLEGNKVKLTVVIDEDEVHREEEATIVRLSREAQVPGFRPGKVPRRLLQARLGPKVIREETLREVLPRFYSDAVEETELDVINVPEIDVTSGEDSGEVIFDAVVEIRPQVSIAGYEGLQITAESPEASEEEISAQVDRLREQFATLTEVGRPARTGDLVTLDAHGTRDGQPAEGLSADDFVYELGTGGIAPGVDERLIGAKIGDIFEMDVADAPGGPAHLRILVKMVREKELPDADDEFASDASEFDTIAELRADLAERISKVKRLQTTLSLRDKALEALSDLVTDEPPRSLVLREAQRLLEDLVHRLSHQQVSLSNFLAATGQEEESLLAEMEQQAERQVKADLALRALVEAESIDIDESDVDEEIVRIADQEKQTPASVRMTLEQNGGLAGLRSQLKQAKAMAWLVEHIAIVDEQGKAMDRSLLQLDTEDITGEGAEDEPVPGGGE